jgi:hypothetical protein
VAGGPGRVVRQGPDRLDARSQRHRPVPHRPGKRNSIAIPTGRAARREADRTAHVVIAGHAFVQNLRRGQYEIGVDACPALRVAAAFTELARAI